MNHRTVTYGCIHHSITSWRLWPQVHTTLSHGTTQMIKKRAEQKWAKWCPGKCQCVEVERSRKGAENKQLVRWEMQKMPPGRHWRPCFKGEGGSPCAKGYSQCDFVTSSMGANFISQAPCWVHDTLTITTQKKEPTPALDGDLSDLVVSAFCLLNAHLWNALSWNPTSFNEKSKPYDEAMGRFCGEGHAKLPATGNTNCWLDECAILDAQPSLAFSWLQPQKPCASKLMRSPARTIQLGPVNQWNHDSSQ